MPGEVHPASAEARHEVVLGVIGGSGLYELPGLEDSRAIAIATPFGVPSDRYHVGMLPREHAPPIKVVFLARHGEGHVLLPSEINYRANVYGLKQLGVTHLVGISAVGSLREDLEPGHVCLPDQFLDRTHARRGTFFGDGLVAHVQFGRPTDEGLRRRVATAVAAAGKTVHEGGTCVVMEGPAFSTRAESEWYRSLHASVIGMTALPEAKLAREAEIAYCLMALVTDYDCWNEASEEVDVGAVIEVFRANVGAAKEIVCTLAHDLPRFEVDLPWPRACEHAILTAPDAISARVRARLDLIVGHYLQA